MPVWTLINYKKGALTGYVQAAALRRLKSIMGGKIQEYCLAGEDSLHLPIESGLNKTFYRSHLDTGKVEILGDFNFEVTLFGKFL